MITSFISALTGFDFNFHIYYYRAKARALKMEQVLKYCLDNAADRDVWDMADQGIFYIVDM